MVIIMSKFFPVLLLIRMYFLKLLAEVIQMGLELLEKTANLVFNLFPAFVSFAID
jgi:hypothetical protein